MSTKDQSLEAIYHRGQDKIWDGSKVLKQLLEKHNGIAAIPEHKKKALHRIFSVILAGELAAWKISLQLAEQVKTTGARMAATSQAHDEARHFYVMRDYLELFEHTQTAIPEPVTQALEMVSSTTSLSKKLLGMQLMVEPIALTIFQEIRRVNPEPVLSELLEYFERDEARHVALGVYYLPEVVKNEGPFKILSLMMWQMRIFMLELQGLKELSADFEALGLETEAVFLLAEQKQLAALQDFVTELGMSPNVWKPLQHFIRMQKKRILT